MQDGDLTDGMGLGQWDFGAIDLNKNAKNPAMKSVECLVHKSNDVVSSSRFSFELSTLVSAL